MAVLRKAGKTRGERRPDAGEAPAPPKASALIIRPVAGKKLSKEQRAFNRLTRRIAELERSIIAEREKLELFLDWYREKISPLEKALARRQVELARALAASSERLALQGNQKQSLREMLLALCSEAFAAQKPDAETEALYDAWSEVGYREQIRRSTEDLKRELADDLRSRFGIEVEIPEDTSPEVMARFFHELKEKARAAEASSSRDSQERSSKRAGRAPRRGRLTATARSLREIYLSLAKVLHPDVVGDDDRRLREESMKQAVRAYRESDVTALLELELRWLAKSHAGRRELPDDALRRYIPALQQQASRLEDSLDEQGHDPRYDAIQAVAFMDERWGLAELKKRVQSLRHATEDVEKMLRYVKGCHAKAELMRLVREYLEELRADG